MGIANSTMDFDSEQLALLQDLRDKLGDQSRLRQSGLQQIEDSLTEIRSIMATMMKDKSDTNSDRLFGESVPGEVQISVTPSPQTQETNPEEQNLKANVYKPQGTFIEHLAGESTYDASYESESIADTGDKRKSHLFGYGVQSHQLINHRRYYDQMTMEVDGVRLSMDHMVSMTRRVSDCSLANQVWEPGGYSTKTAQGDRFKEFYSYDRALRLMQSGNSRPELLVDSAIVFVFEGNSMSRGTENLNQYGVALTPVNKDGTAERQVCDSGRENHVWKPGELRCTKAPWIWLKGFSGAPKKQIRLVLNHCPGLHKLDGSHGGVDNIMCLTNEVCASDKRPFVPGIAFCGECGKELLVADQIIQASQDRFRVEVVLPTKFSMGELKLPLDCVLEVGLIHLEDKMSFSGASRHMWRGMANKEVKKKLRGDEDHRWWDVNEFQGTWSLSCVHEFGARSQTGLCVDAHTREFKKNVWSGDHEVKFSGNEELSSEMKWRIELRFCKSHDSQMNDHSNRFSCKDSGRQVAWLKLTEGITVPPIESAVRAGIQCYSGASWISFDNTFSSSSLGDPQLHDRHWLSLYKLNRMRMEGSKREVQHVEDEVKKTKNNFSRLVRIRSVMAMERNGILWLHCLDSKIEEWLGICQRLQLPSGNNTIAGKEKHLRIDWCIWLPSQSN